MPILSQEIIGNETKLSDFTIRINDCIALCRIADDFDDFTKNLKEFSKGINGYSRLKSLYKYIVENKNTSSKVKDFYFKNNSVLSSIHDKTYISNFLLIYFDREKGKFNQEISEMYEYIKSNKNNIDKILSVFNKLSDLGFDSITFAQNEKFDDVYEYDKLDDYYYYVDGNIEVIPSLDGFKYKTEGANYEIEFSRVPFHNAIITLNNLVFDSNLLPNNLSFDNTTKKILDLKEEKKESCKVLNTIVSLDYNLENILPAIEKIDEIINNIHNCEYKQTAKEYTKKAKEAAYGLRTCLTNYQTDMVNQNLITEEILYDETKKYKRRNS